MTPVIYTIPSKEELNIIDDMDYKRYMLNLSRWINNTISVHNLPTILRYYTFYNHRMIIRDRQLHIFTFIPLYYERFNSYMVGKIHQELFAKTLLKDLEDEQSYHFNQQTGKITIFLKTNYISLLEL